MLSFSRLRAVFSGLLCLSQLCSAKPELLESGNILVERAGSVSTAIFFGSNAATFAVQIPIYLANGYRLTSINVFGGTTTPTYVASAVQETGPAQQVFYNGNLLQYETWINQNMAAGYVPTLVTATGPRNLAIFAAVMEKVPVTNWYQKCDLTTADFKAENEAAFHNRQLLRSFDEYGVPTDRRYCGIWYDDPNVDKSTLFLSLGSADYQNAFNSETTKPYWRPTFLAVSDDIKYSALYTDTSIGNTWVARHGLSLNSFQNEVSIQASQGRFIVNLAAGGPSPTAPTYSAIFASQFRPSLRTWRIDGPPTKGPFHDDVNNNQRRDATPDLESLVKDFMQSAGVRQAQLAIGWEGDVLFDRAFTWSEPERTTTAVQDKFLLADLSMAFLEAAIQLLYDNSTFTCDTTVYPLLGYDCRSGDRRRCDITVQHFLDHYSGYSDDGSNLAFDPTYKMREIALSRSNGLRPATLSDIIDFVFPNNLKNDPGEEYSYLNYGYIVLAALIEQLTENDYFRFLTDALLRPQGLDVDFYRTSQAAHLNDRVVQESRFTGLSALEPLNPSLVAFIYGGDDQYKESAIGSNSLKSAASTLVKFISGNSVWLNGDRAPGLSRLGSTAGASTWIESRCNGYDWALLVNTADFPDGEQEFLDLVEEINKFLGKLEAY